MITRATFNSFPIRKKLTVIIVGICVIALFMSSLIQGTFALFNEKKKLVDQLSITMKVISMQTGATLAFHDPVAAEENLASLQSDPAIKLACIYSDDGKLFASYPKTFGAKSNCPNESSDTTVFSGNTLNIFRSIDVANKRVGTIYLEYSLTETYNNLSKEWFFNLAAIALAIGFVFLLSSYFQYTISQPIMELAGKLKEFSHTRDYSIRVPRKNEDELGELVDSFNRMIEEIGKNNFELVEAKNKAEAGSKAKSEFLANMSHELRTPMNAVIGLSHILLNVKTDPKKSRLCLETLNESANTLLSLINDLLDFSKIESNSLTLEYIPFNLYNIINEVQNLSKVKASEKNLYLNIDYPDSVPQMFIGDSLRIRQILLNLVSNATKFTEKGGITVEIIGSRLSHNEMQISINIKDTGIGIPQDKLKDIFQKFTQADSSTTRKYGGTGLGLAICKKLTHLMGGSISVSSIAGEGSVFTVKLPLLINNEQNINTIKMVEKGGNAVTKKMREERILVVEDHAANIIVATSILEELGYRHDVVNNGQEALDAFKLHKYDLILMDIQMPVMDGYQATKLIREYEKAHNLPRKPIIAITAYSMANDYEKTLKAGMDEHISKPFRSEELEEKIDFLLNHAA